MHVFPVTGGLGRGDWTERDQGPGYEGQNEPIHDGSTTEFQRIVSLWISQSGYEVRRPDIDVPTIRNIDPLGSPVEGSGGLRVMGAKDGTHHAGEAA